MATMISDDDKKTILDALDTAIMYSDDSSHPGDAAASKLYRDTYKRIAGKEYSVLERK